MRHSYISVDNVPEKDVISSSTTPRREPAVTRDDTPKTLLVSQTTDIDEQTLYFWLKSIFDVWAISIQMSVSGDSAIVKIPAGCDIGKYMTNDTIDLVHTRMLIYPCGKGSYVPIL